MESLDGHAVKFSLKHILNLGQYDILSRCDSFGDIPGHGEIFFLDRKILWTLKSNLILFLGMSFAALYKIYFRGTWSEMPMDEFRQLSVTFPDCFVSSVLGAVSVVTFTSYNFSTGGKQHGSLFRSFIERYVFRNLQTGERTLDGEFFSEFLGSHSRFLSKFSMVYIYIFSFFSTFSFKFSHISLQRNTRRWGFQLCGQSSRCSSFANQHFFPNSRFVT